MGNFMKNMVAARFAQFTYNNLKKRYLHLLENDINSIPEELHFIMDLPKSDSIAFIALIQEQCGSLYYPGIYKSQSSKNDKNYYQVKKEFLAKRNKVESQRKVMYKCGSIFPNAEYQQIALSAEVDSPKAEENIELDQKIVYKCGSIFPNSEYQEIVFSAEGESSRTKK